MPDIQPTTFFIYLSHIANIAPLMLSLPILLIIYNKLKMIGLENRIIISGKTKNVDQEEKQYLK
jgi:hypothetical protein